jgi:hypothetical protein
VRIAYLDESGTGDPVREPHVVVAAIIVHADKQWRALVTYLADMAAAHVPKDKIAQFKGFHANELFSGGKIFERRDGEFGRWWPVLEELLSIPQKFDLPVCFGSVERKLYEFGGEGYEGAVKSNIKPLVAAQMTAFSAAAYGVEHWMKSVAAPDEVAEMIMENNADTRDHLKIMQRMLADKNQRNAFLTRPEMKKTFDFSRIMWPVRFEEKGDETSALQIVDACAWAIRRRLAGDPDSDRFYDLLAPKLINKLRDGLPEVRQRKPKKDGQSS